MNFDWVQSFAGKKTNFYIEFFCFFQNKFLHVNSSPHCYFLVKICGGKKCFIMLHTYIKVVFTYCLGRNFLRNDISLIKNCRNRHQKTKVARISARRQVNSQQCTWNWCGNDETRLVLLGPVGFGIADYIYRPSNTFKLS